jgi:hypothetical protein
VKDAALVEEIAILFSEVRFGGTNVLTGYVSYATESGNDPSNLDAVRGRRCRRRYRVTHENDS